MPSFLFLLTYFCIGHQSVWAIPEAILMNLEWDRRKPLIEEFVFNLLVQPPPPCQTISLRQKPNYLSMHSDSSSWTFTMSLWADNRIRFYRGLWISPFPKTEWLAGLELQFQLIRLMTKVEQFLERGCWKRVPSYTVIPSVCARSMNLEKVIFAWKNPEGRILVYVMETEKSRDGSLRYALEVEEFLFVLTSPQQTIRRRLLDERTGLLLLERTNHVDSDSLLKEIGETLASFHRGCNNG